RPKRIA
nr:Chain D, Rcc1 [Homo sapiens]5E1O_E Chain E, Rcc1 [Homo sapiens]